MGTNASLKATGTRRATTPAGAFFFQSSNTGSKLKQWMQL